ncbi:MAG: insulinase family protein, partial [Phycisphaerae bacterium]|nr:insulinase family protein [Phycisphaerae bacterium]NIP53282.1 insulinase family protein [Phycisphaerae bacterium]NIS52303.1 insulinase family protein [Phycisphaerae bacterium]NIU09844.1 insulinase family protein [Phycisphaerae bacterium]NIU57500.1 insulinase family protein [Phycisphaerae bacterium]
MKHTERKPSVATGAVILFLVTAFLAPTPLLAQHLAEFEQRMTKFTLDNGLKFLVLERHEAPVVSFHTYADVGSVDEVR